MAARLWTPRSRGPGVPGARLGASRRQRQRRARAGRSPRVARRRDLVSAAVRGAAAKRPAAAGACSTGLRNWSAEGMPGPQQGVDASPGDDGDSRRPAVAFTSFHVGFPTGGLAM